MLVLNCRIEFEGARKWTLTNLVNIKIERNADSMMDWCEIELPSRLRWDCKRECPLQRGDKVNIWLGYNDELELAFKGYVLQIYNLEKLTIFCGDSMCSLQYKELKNGTLTSKEFIETLIKEINNPLIINDERINVGEFYFRGTSIGLLLSDLYSKYKVRSGFIIKNGKEYFYLGNIRNTKIISVFDIERNVIKNNLTKNRAIEQGYDLLLISINSRNEKIRYQSYFGEPPFRKIIYRYYNLTEKELDDELDRVSREFYFRRYAGTITVFGGHLVEKYDLIGLKENGEKRGVYEVQKNVITFGLNGYRQIITLGNERRDAE